MQRGTARNPARLAAVVFAVVVAATALAGGVEYYRPGSDKSDRTPTKPGRAETYRPGTTDRDPYYRPGSSQGPPLSFPYVTGRGYPWDRLAALQMEELALRWRYYGLFSKGTYKPEEVVALARQLDRIEREKARLNREVARYGGTARSGGGAPDYYRYGDDRTRTRPPVEYYRK